jgi:hypothetical protein
MGQYPTHAPGLQPSKRRQMMGEIAEMMTDGTMCQYCGVWNDEITEGGPDEVFEPQGYPWTCDDCKEDEKDGPDK